MRDLPNSPDPSVPHAWIPIRDWAELNEALEAAEHERDTATAKVKAYAAGLERIIELCKTDDSRAFIGKLAYDVRYPPLPTVAKPGQETITCA